MSINDYLMQRLADRFPYGDRWKRHLHAASDGAPWRRIWSIN